MSEPLPHRATPAILRARVPAPPRPGRLSLRRTGSLRPPRPGPGAARISGFSLDCVSATAQSAGNWCQLNPPTRRPRRLPWTPAPAPADAQAVPLPGPAAGLDFNKPRAPPRRSESACQWPPGPHWQAACSDTGSHGAPGPGPPGGSRCTRGPTSPSPTGSPGARNLNRDLNMS